MTKTKDELSEELNQVLPIDEQIDFTRLLKDDLWVLYQLLKDPRRFAKEYLMEKGEDKIADLIVSAKEVLEEEGKRPKIGRGKLLSKLLDID